MELPTYLIPVLVGAGGIGGLVWTAVNFRRDDTTKVVAQTQEVVTMLRALIEELEKALVRAEKYGATTWEQLCAERAVTADLTRRLEIAERKLNEALRRKGGSRG